MQRGFYRDHGKRMLDLIVAVAAIAVLTPLLVLLAVAIAIDSRGPVFYRQERVGRGGRTFRLWKLRSMVVGASAVGAGIFVEKDDPRVTRVGRVIRRLSLDEIPQLFNVLTGDMSLVGPRPGLRYQVELYDRVQMRRLLVRPGITGWAQVNGRKALDWGRRIELDLEYVGRMSLAFDVYVMLRTFPALLSSEGHFAPSDYWKAKAREATHTSRPIRD